MAVKKPSELYKIRVGITSSGERIPLLVDAKSGLPVVLPNQYMLRDRRPRSETATLEKELRHIAMLCAWAITIGVDLSERLQCGEGLRPHEVSNLVEAARADLREPRAHIERLVKPVVSNATWASRLYVIRDYITWALNEAIARADIGTMRYEHLRERRAQIANAITSRIPYAKSGEVEGLSPELRERLWDVIRPESVENPWQRGLRYRNRLIVEFFSKLGPRSGELLKIRVSGVQTAMRPLVYISREGDSVDDARRREPRAKTLARAIPLGDALREMTDDYLLKERSRIPGAKRSPYLVLSRDGEPLSLSGLRDVINQIRNRHPEFRNVITPHVLRHTAADLWWSQLEKSDKLSAGARKEIFNYLMGWSEGSKQGEKYPKGEIVRAAQDLALVAQRELFKPVNGLSA